ncbi:MAG: LPS export ABC transporter periplasmic protein LptC [Janthinobacterium lividum]
MKDAAPGTARADAPAVAAAVPAEVRKHSLWRNRRGRRFSTLFLLAMAAMLALGSFWVLEVMRRSTDQAGPATVRTEPDYYVEKFNFVRMASTGEVEYKISGERLTHDPVADTHEITMPVVVSLSKVRPPTTVRSLRAVSNADNSEVQMYRQVSLDRPAAGTAAAFHLQSEYLLVLPDDDVMKTDKQVDMTLGTSKLSGSGMVVDNAKRQLSLAHNVHFLYQPPAATAVR